MNLELLLKDINTEIIIEDRLKFVEIDDLTTDPNLCRGGFLYVAAECETVDSSRYGFRLDGHDFIETAVKNGASAILAKTGTEKSPIFSMGKKMPPLVTAQEPLKIFGYLCARLFNKQPANIALVTGTNGKTSTVNFARMLWSAAGLASCSIGNLGGVLSDGRIIWQRDPTLSVPETVELHKMLKTLSDLNVHYLAMEATSHALYDYRLNGVKASTGAFTNLTRDHLDFHKSMEEYFRVKMMMFQEVIPENGNAILNADADYFSQAYEICRKRGQNIISYGRQGKEVRLIESKQDLGGHELSLEIFGKKYKSRLNLRGEFQLSNALCALSIVLASGIDPEFSSGTLEQLKEVEGRLNLVDRTQSGASVIVDYAHSPDGLEAALKACRSFCAGRLLLVFGCNGERDPGKRAEMGEIASELADIAIVTDGHPRSEDPAKIRKDVIAGAKDAIEVAGRAKAIEFAIGLLKENDILLIAGLGHENFQTIGSERIKHSDREVVLKALALQKRMKENEGGS